MDEERMKEMVPRRMTTLAGWVVPVPAGTKERDLKIQGAQPQGLGVVRHVAFQQKGD
jgi:hypothetical protein